jgi:hypothetical protein
MTETLKITKYINNNLRGRHTRIVTCVDSVLVTYIITNLRSAELYLYAVSFKIKVNLLIIKLKSNIIYGLIAIHRFLMIIKFLSELNKILKL